jgi:hypothetical protein
MGFFIRMEETHEQAQASLQRKKSVRRWAFAGCTPWEHLAFAIPEEEQKEALEEYYGRDIEPEEIGSLIHDELFQESDDERLAEILNLTRLESGYYAEFLDGLCALESYDEEPSPESIDIPAEYQFRYMVCYEGEPAGIDEDEGWELFTPSRIVWIHDTGGGQKRLKHI